MCLCVCMCVCKAQQEEVIKHVTCQSNEWLSTASPLGEFCLSLPITPPPPPPPNEGHNNSTWKRARGASDQDCYFLLGDPWPTCRSHCICACLPASQPASQPASRHLIWNLKINGTECLHLQQVSEWKHVFMLHCRVDAEPWGKPVELWWFSHLSGVKGFPVCGNWFFSISMSSCTAPADWNRFLNVWPFGVL